MWMNLPPLLFLRRECIPCSMLSNKHHCFMYEQLWFQRIMLRQACLWMPCKLFFVSSVESCSYWWIFSMAFFELQIEHHTWPDSILRQFLKARHSTWVLCHLEQVWFPEWAKICLRTIAGKMVDIMVGKPPYLSGTIRTVTRQGREQRCHNHGKPRMEQLWLLGRKTTNLEL